MPKVCPKSHLGRLLVQQFTLRRLLCLLLSLEVRVINVRGNIDARNINLGRGSNDVRLVHPTQGNTVDFVGAGNQEQTRRQLLEEDDALSTETTSKEDEDGSRGDACTQLGGVGSLPRLPRFRDVVGRVEARALDLENFPLSSVFGSTNLLGHGCRSLLLLGSLLFREMKGVRFSFPCAKSHP